jgi:thioesterase domain-containing protein/aryl carrier-like protein
LSGGAGLARGYRNRPELTAEKFIPHPFSDQLSARLYKTGDLARWRPEGTIEFLGRLDHQVKLRGFRIELGEIEAVLAQHPVVGESVVLVREDTGGDKRLVAYLVIDRHAAPDSSELRRFLKTKLPEYMVPSAFVMLDALPLTPNGKVDRQALPAPAAARPDRERPFLAPRDPLELQLTQIWETLLRIQPIGVRDNFFALGGHSLLAMRLLAQIEKNWGQRLPLATLFQAPTVEQFAGLLRQQGWSLPWVSLVPIQPGGSQRPFFCVSPGATLFLADLARHLGPDQPFYGLQALGLEGEQRPLTQLEAIATHYLQEVRSLQPAGPYRLGGRCFGSLVAYEMAQQLHAQGEEVALLVFLDDGPEPLLPAPQPPAPRGVDYYLQRLIYHLRRRQLTRALRSQSEALQQALRYLVGSAQTRRMLRLEEANMAATQRYVMRPYPGRITLMRSRATVARGDKRWHLRWEELAADGLECHVVPGTHVTMLKEPLVAELAARLRACLEQAERQPAARHREAGGLPHQATALRPSRERGRTASRDGGEPGEGSGSGPVGERQGAMP